MTDLLLRTVRRVGTSGTPADVRIVDGRVTAVAPAGTLDAAGPDTDVVQTGGAWLGPGLVDHHVHFDQWALVRRRVDVSGCASAEATADLLAEVLRTGPVDGVLVGHGYRDGLWPRPARRELLDRAAPRLPAVVISGDLHAVWCNALALERLSAEVGRPLVAGDDGVLREQDAFDVTAALSRVPDAVLDGYVTDAVEAAAARGVTRIVDLEMRFGLDRWTRRVHAGTDGLRVASGVYPDELDDVVARGLRTGDVVPGTRGLLTMGPFKVITDGSLGTRTAATADGEGVLAYGFDDLVAMVRCAVDAGLVPAVHAIGDRANTLALDVFEAVGTRGSIEHAQLLDGTDLERFARLGVVASVQPEHAMDDRDIADRHWAGVTDRAFPFAALERAGATLRLGSDAPVAPLDPWVGMAAAVGRDRGGREPWHPEQRMSALAAWRGSTDGRVSVAVGDVADLVLLPADPLAVATTETSDLLRSMPVLATAIAGRFTHRSA
ncbi:amidohydrolase family protein [Curtobacterium sp. Csp1]|uniref:amidohydrolase n=1 Tax=unclassified Curtobacterium TaxID=257496 RepID=UPI0015989028|nr:MULTISPECIES: amidohydrolase family protein [unclassified Curtobacterium]QKS12090.1 amidohydrolase family protein [Curtobacterium sp. csp3]QKS21600.1 amidohydrolase family protein [Curtobacterium sp. Csp1]